MEVNCAFGSYPATRFCWISKVLLNSSVRVMGMSCSVNPVSAKSSQLAIRPTLVTADAVLDFVVPTAVLPACQQSSSSQKRSSVSWLLRNPPLIDEPSWTISIRPRQSSNHGYRQRTCPVRRKDGVSASWGQRGRMIPQWLGREQLAHLQVR